MTARRRLTGECKARVVLQAWRGDQTVQEIAAKHKMHPNQVSTR
jgi:transposase